MKKELIFILFFCICNICNAQKFNVSGYVNSSSGEVLPYASCFDLQTNKLVFANEDGFFVMPCKVNSAELIFSFVGCKSRTHSFTMSGDTLINIYLETSQIKEVVVIEKTEPLYRQNMMGKYKIRIDELNASSSFTASTDIFKAITQISGISNGREGYSNFYVRGGDKDENTVLIDNAPVYELTATGGFFSLYNPKMISEMYVYKEGFPAQFGGRNSSVVDIKLQDGNYTNFSGDISIGIPNASVYLNVPLHKDCTVLTLGVRSCYLSPFLYPSKLKFEQTIEEHENGIEPIDAISQYTMYGFNDMTGKLVHRFNNRLKLSIASIISTENYGFESLSSSSDHYDQDKTKLNTTNSLVVANLIKIKKTPGYWKLTASYAGTRKNMDNFIKSNDHDDFYESSNNAETEVDRFDLKFLMNDQVGQAHNIKWGVSLAHENFNPVKYEIQGSSMDTSYFMGKEHFHQLYNVFIDDQIEIVNRLNIYPGLRVTLFNGGFYFDPRFSVRYQINSRTSVKGAYTITHQFSEQLSMRDTGIEWNTWVGVENRKPCRTEQFALGAFGMLDVLNIEYGLETFYKSSTDRIYYFPDCQDDIADFLEWEDYLEKGGKGEAYGVETTLKGQYEKFNWQTSYVLAWNYLTFDGINNGDKFPSLYDKRHELSFSGIFKMNANDLIGCSFLFHSGEPVTLPEGYAQANSLMGKNWGGYNLFSSINNYRMPVYHRLDLSYTHKWLSKKNRKWYFKANVYNVYNHSNAYKLLINGGEIYKVSNFTVLPSVNIGIEF